MKKIIKEIGKELRSIRKEKKISLQEVANKAGVSSMYISEIEREKKTPSDEMIYKLAEIYRLNAQNLFEGFGRIPEEMQDEIVNNPDVFRVLYKLTYDENISSDKKESFIQEVSNLYNKYFQ